MTIDQKYKELHQLINDMEIKHQRILQMSHSGQIGIENDSFDDLLIELFKRNLEIGKLLGSKRNNKNKKRKKTSKKKRGVSIRKR